MLLLRQKFNFLSKLPVRFPIAHRRVKTSMLMGLMVIPLACSVSTDATSATKVAFIADQDIHDSSREVLSLIRDEGADIVLIQGDLGYDPNSASTWDKNISDILGRNFPVLSLVGNHENYEWPVYQRLIEQRIDRIDGLSCTGEVGVKASCTFNKLQVVQVAQGVGEVPGVDSQDNYDDFIRSSFNNSSTPWKVCAWHKNQNAMQAYSKPDSTGWDVYNACLDVGAMIATGHAHTYSRTYLMEDFQTQRVAHRSNEMLLEPGRSLAVVSGLGGRDIRSQENDGDWFASIYTKTQGATHGALFCSLGQSTAECYFKAINGAVPDSFTLKLRPNSANAASNVGTKIPSTQPALSNPSTSVSTGVFRRTDKDEYRWIAKDNTGQWASRWISQACATDLGGARYSGNWYDLTALASRIDTSASPCDGNVKSSDSLPLATPYDRAGYVFARSDKSAFRWIDTNNSGQMGSIWIDQDCASRLGGVSATGDWGDLISIAPAFDTLDNPC